MCRAAAGDDGFDPSRPEQPTVLVVVIATIGEHDIGLLPWSPWLAADRSGVQQIEQRQELGDVVAVPAGQRDGERDPGRVNQQMVL